MNRPLTKTCEICRHLFAVEPRVGARQRVCKKLACQRERKRRYLNQWLAEDCTYYQRRYADYLKAWRATHPAYQKHYRARQRDHMRQLHGEIQVELSSYQTTPRGASAEKQVEITFNLFMPRRTHDEKQVQSNSSGAQA